MLDVLLVRIQPSDLSYNQRFKDYETFPTHDPCNFEISVSNGNSLHFTVSKKYYMGSNTFYRMGKANDFGIPYSGHVVAIDKYPGSQFIDGAQINEQRDSGITRYEVECHSEDFTYHSMILLAPGLQPIILANLNFAYGEESAKGYCSSFIVFEKETLLSLKSPFGEVIGIPLKSCCESALKPDRKMLSYTMSFEKVSLPAVVLQKLLETKPQAGK